MPVPTCSAEEYLPDVRQSQQHYSRGCFHWMWVLIVLLNAWYTGVADLIPIAEGPSAVQKGAFGYLLDQVGTFLDREESCVPDLDWAKLLRDKDINYQGEAVQRARHLTWPQVLPGLPPPERCASVPVLDLCEGLVADYLQDPVGSLSGLPTAEACPRPGAMMVRPRHKYRIA